MMSGLLEVCRLCMKKFSSPDQRENIFSSAVVTLETIRAVTQIEIVVGDGLPPNVCQSCILKLNDAKNFIESCIKCNEKLKLECRVSTPECGIPPQLKTEPSPYLHETSEQANGDLINVNPLAVAENEREVYLKYEIFDETDAADICTPNNDNTELELDVKPGPMGVTVIHASNLLKAVETGGQPVADETSRDESSLVNLEVQVKREQIAVDEENEAELPLHEEADEPNVLELQQIDTKAVILTQGTYSVCSKDNVTDLMDSILPLHVESSASCQETSCFPANTAITVHGHESSKESVMKIQEKNTGDQEIESLILPQVPPQPSSVRSISAKKSLLLRLARQRKKGVQCPKCCRIFPRLILLRQHACDSIESHKAFDSSRMFECNDCFAGFSSLTSLGIHKKHHKRNRRYHEQTKSHSQCSDFDVNSSDSEGSIFELNIPDSENGDHDIMSSDSEGSVLRAHSDSENTLVPNSDSDSCDINRSDSDSDACDINESCSDSDSCDINNSDSDSDCCDINKSDSNSDACDINKSDSETDTCEPNSDSEEANLDTSLESEGSGLIPNSGSESDRRNTTTDSDGSITKSEGFSSDPDTETADDSDRGTVTSQYSERKKNVENECQVRPMPTITHNNSENKLFEEGPDSLDSRTSSRFLVENAASGSASGASGFSNGSTEGLGLLDSDANNSPTERAGDIQKRKSSCTDWESVGVPLTKRRRRFGSMPCVEPGESGGVLASVSPVCNRTRSRKLSFTLNDCTTKRIPKKKGEAASIKLRERSQPKIALTHKVNKADDGRYHKGGEMPNGSVIVNQISDEFPVDRDLGTEIKEIGSEKAAIEGKGDFSQPNNLVLEAPEMEKTDKQKTSEKELTGNTGVECVNGSGGKAMANVMKENGRSTISSCPSNPEVRGPKKLREERKSVHTGAPALCYQCWECGRKFESGDELINHFRRHLRALLVRHTC